jgi:hypothetical protein
MADYIDKNILFQAYVHIQLSSTLTTNRLEQLQRELTDFAEARERERGSVLTFCTSTRAKARG